MHDCELENSALVSFFFDSDTPESVDTDFYIPNNSSKNIMELYGSKGSIFTKGTIDQGSAGR